MTVSNLPERKDASLSPDPWSHLTSSVQGTVGSSLKYKAPPFQHSPKPISTGVLSPFIHSLHPLPIPFQHSQRDQPDQQPTQNAGVCDCPHCWQGCYPSGCHPIPALHRHTQGMTACRHPVHAGCDRLCIDIHKVSGQGHRASSPATNLRARVQGQSCRYDAKGKRGCHQVR